MEIFRIEKKHAMKHGGAALIDKLKQAGHDPYSDMDRPPLPRVCPASSKRGEVKIDACHRVTFMRMYEQADTEYFVCIVLGDMLTPKEMRFDRIL